MKVQSTFYIDFISKTVDVLLISSFITKQMPKLLIFDAFTLLICKKNVAIYALLRCKIFSLKIWLCKIFDKFHVCIPLQVSGKEAFILFLFFLLLLYSVVTFLKSWNKNYRDINHLPFYTMCEDKTSIAPGCN